MISGMKPIGLRCRHLSQTIKHYGEPRRSCSSVGRGGSCSLPPRIALFAPLFPEHSLPTIALRTEAKDCTKFAYVYFRCAATIASQRARTSARLCIRSRMILSASAYSIASACARKWSAAICAGVGAALGILA
jgi:hypothetical protein